MILRLMPRQSNSSAIHLLAILFVMADAVKALTPEPLGIPTGTSAPFIIGSTDSQLFYYASVPSPTGTEFESPHHWKVLGCTDGTRAGTRSLSGATTAAYTYGVSFRDKFLFASDSFSKRAFMNYTDGTVEGTGSFQISSTNYGYDYVSVMPLTVHGGYTYFSNDDLRQGSPSIWEHILKRTDGTSEGTTAIKAFGSTLSAFKDAGEKHFFTADADLSGSITDYKTYLLNGEALTALDLNPNNDIRPVTLLGSPDGTHMLYIGATDAAHAGLWSTDGTPEGTVFLKPLSGGRFYSSGGIDEYVFSTSSQVHQGLVYFTDSTGVWVSDGTTTGTRIILTGDYTGITDFVGTDHGIWLCSIQFKKLVSCSYYEFSTSSVLHTSSVDDSITPESWGLASLISIGDDLHYLSTQGPVAVSAADGTHTLLKSLGDDTPTGGFIKFKGQYWFTSKQHLWCMGPLAQPIPEETIRPFVLSTSSGAKGKGIALQGTIISSWTDTSPATITSWFELYAPTNSIENPARYLTRTTPRQHPIASTINCQETFNNTVPGNFYLIRLVVQSGDQLTYSDYEVYFGVYSPALLAGLAIKTSTDSEYSWLPLDFTTQEHQVAATATSISFSDNDAQMLILPPGGVFINGKPFTKKTPRLTFKLKPGKNAFKIVSYSKNWKHKQAYTLTIIRPKAS